MWRSGGYGSLRGFGLPVQFHAIRAFSVLQFFAPPRPTRGIACHETNFRLVLRRAMILGAKKSGCRNQGCMGDDIAG
jgi:hypothetical protein